MQFTGNVANGFKQARVGGGYRGCKRHDDLNGHAGVGNQRFEFSDKLFSRFVWQYAAIQLSPRFWRYHIDFAGTLKTGHGAGISGQGVVTRALFVQALQKLRILNRPPHIRIGRCPFIIHGF